MDCCGECTVLRNIPGKLLNDASDRFVLSPAMVAERLILFLPAGIVHRPGTVAIWHEFRANVETLVDTVGDALPE